ncbi:hypothetical protein GCM10027059_32410 [Myceligenerans halotolerans]
MRYLMLVLNTPEDPGDTEATMPIEERAEKVYGSGAGIVGDRLRPQEDAVGARVRGGEVLVTDGPFTEAKESIGGFDVIEATDLDDAVRIASEHPMAFGGAIELRPFWPLGIGED